MTSPTPDVAATVAELRARLGGIAQEECGGDNLAILLASYFEPGIEDDELDDSGTWKQGAIDACEKVLDAIHAHYAPLLEHLEAERQNQAKALSEANERIAELEHGVSDQIEDAEYHKQKRLAAEARR